MALSVLSDGDLASVGDVNQYKNLLTGVMTDQAVELNYRPGSGTTPTLLLDGDGSGPLIKGYKTDHSTTAFQIDASGNLTVAAAVTSSGKYKMSMAGAGDPDILRFTPTDSEKDIALYYDHTDDGWALYNYTNSNAMVTFKSNGDMTLTGAFSGSTAVLSSYVQAASYRGPSNAAASFYVYDNALGTVRAIRIFIGTTDPSTYTTINEGDIWIKA